MLETVVCTISDEGTPHKNELVKETMEGLQALASKSKGKVRVTGIHLGDDDPEIGLMFENYFPEIIVVPTLDGNFVQKARKGMLELFCGAKRAVEASVKAGARAIIYMEGDKPRFVQYIGEVVAPILEEVAAVTVATRSAKGFAAFPTPQKFWEGRANKKIAEMTGREIDLMYGPRAWNPQCARYFSGSQRSDFGALTESVVRAMAEGKSVVGVEVPGFPQDDYMKKYPGVIRIPPMHFVYRAIQNGPHIEAAQFAIENVRK